VGRAIGQKVFPLVRSQALWLTLFKVAVNTLPVHLQRMSEFLVEGVHCAVHRNTGVVLWRNVRWCLHTFVSTVISPLHLGHTQKKVPYSLQMVYHTATSFV